MKHILILLIRFYKFFISPVIVSIFGHACRFDPTCSEYTLEAVQKHGAIKGVVMGAKRLSRCHPFNFRDNIYDPLPQK